MNRVAFLAVLAASPAFAAGASNFTLVNGTGASLAELSIRRAGTQEWKPLGSAPVAGARGPMKFSDPDCAFDIRANVAGAGPTTWADVNLCAVKSVTLNRDGSAGAWVDYDH
jgi:hypothetical protein